MEVIELSEESKNKIDEYKKFSKIFPIFNNDLGPNIMIRMNIIIKNNQIENFKEFSKYTMKVRKQNIYEMKNYYYQSYLISLVSAVRGNKLNIYTSHDIMSYFTIPEFISIESMRKIFEFFITRDKNDINIKYYKIKI